MPWSVHSPMSRRLEFVDDAARGLYSMTELYVRYAISRRVGYKRLARYEADGVDGLVDQRRVAPSPTRTACRKTWPHACSPAGTHVPSYRSAYAIKRMGVTHLAGRRSGEQTVFTTQTASS